MCLGIPGKVVEVDGTGLMCAGKVDFDGVVKEVSFAYVPEVEIGQWVIVHMGFATAVLDEAAAQETLALLRRLDSLADEKNL